MVKAGRDLQFAGGVTKSFVVFDGDLVAFVMGGHYFLLVVMIEVVIKWELVVVCGGVVGLMSSDRRVMNGCGESSHWGDAS